MSKEQWSDFFQEIPIHDGSVHDFDRVVLKGEMGTDGLCSDACTCVCTCYCSCTGMHAVEFQIRDNNVGTAVTGAWYWAWLGGGIGC